MPAAKVKFGTKAGEGLTQEFQLCVTSVGADDYLVQTTKVAPGVPSAQALVKLPIGDWLAQSTQLAAESEKFTNAGRVHHLAALGQQFYAALFSGSLQASWSNAQALAQQQQQGLRLRLSFPDQLASLPWEILHTGDRFLATDPAIAVSRYITTPSSTAPPVEPQLATVAPTLLSDVVKVLVVVAAPPESLGYALQQEIVRLQVELCQRQLIPVAIGINSTELEFTLLEQPSIEQLCQALEQEQYQIVHYIAAAATTEPDIAIDNLAGLLNRYGIQVVVFNFCDRASRLNLTATAGITEIQLTQELVKCGVHTILSMGRYVPDAIALIAVREFYRHLSQGYAGDFSLSRVRAALISASSAECLDWARPIFYLQPEADGNLTTEAAERLVVSELDLGKQVQPDNDSAAIADLAEILDSLELEAWEEATPIYQDDDPTYQADSALVADLFHQIVNPAVDNAEQVDTVANNQTETRSDPPVAIPSSPHPTSVESTDLIYSLSSSSARGQKPSQITRAISLVLSVVGIPLISYLGLRWQYWQPPLQAALPSVYQFLLTQPFALKLKTASAADLAAIAVAHFRQQDLSAGYLAVTELLDRKELNSASIALAAVSPAQSETGEINFLHGRLAWQALQTGDQHYSWEDVRHYWEAAVRYQPNSPVYYNALGFAYYAAGELNRANQTWFQALYLAEEQQAATTGASTDQITLNIYAGLALVLRKAAIDQPQAKQAELLSEALKLQQKVLQEDPVNFRPRTISRNWLWTEQAAQDWRSLLAVSNQD